MRASDFHHAREAWRQDCSSENADGMFEEGVQSKERFEERAQGRPSDPVDVETLI